MKPTCSLVQRLFFAACCYIPRILIASEVEDSQRYDVYAYNAQVHVDYNGGGGQNHYQLQGLRYLSTFQAGDFNMDSLSIHLNGFSPSIVHSGAVSPNVNGDPCMNANIVDAQTGEVFVYDTVNKTFAENLTLEGSESSILLVGDRVKQVWDNCNIKNPGNSFTRFAFFVLARPVGQEGPTPESDLEEYLPDGTNLYGIGYRDIEHMLSELFPPGSYRISDPDGEGGYPELEDWRRLYPPPPGYPYDEGDPDGHNPPGGGGGDCNTCDDSCLAEAGAENGSLRVTVPIRDGVEVTVESDAMQTDYYATNLLKLPKSVQYAYVYESLPTGRISEIYTGTELCTFDAHGTGGLTIEVHEVADGSAPDGSGSYRYLIAPDDSSLRYAAELDVQNGGSTVEVKLDTVLPYAKTRYKRFTYLTNLEGTTGKNGWLFSHLSADQTTTLLAHLKTVYDSTAGGVVYQTITERLVDPLHPTDTTKYASFVEKKYRKYLLGSEEHWLLVESTSGLGALAETILYDYEDAGVNRGKLISTRYPDGNWERFEYDGLGRRTKHIRSYLGNDWSNNSAAANRVTEYDYTVTQPDDTGLQLRKARTVTEKVQGAVISKTFIVVGNGFERTEQAGSATAAVGDATNLITTTYTDGLRTVTELPDGRIRTREITKQVDFEFTTTAIGAPGAGPYAAPIDQEVGEGDVTVVERDITEDRRVRSSKRYWRQPGAANDLLLTGSTSTFGNDGIGDPRASRMDYEDGTYTLHVYSCCGLLSQTDKDGITTTYGHDDMERVIRTSRSGVTSHMEYDVGGRVHRTARTPETTQTLAEVEAASPADVIGLMVSEYDILGRRTRQTDPAGRVTAYARSVDALTRIVTTTTYLPDGTPLDLTNNPTRIQKTYADGTPIETLGTAARHMTTTISWDANGQRITEEAYTSNTNEFTRITADFLGRTVKTERPSPTGTGLATTERIYETGTGRFIEALDPSGLRTLYQYNELNQQEVMAVDVNDNGQIDLGGTDQVTSNVVEYVDATFDSITYATRKTSSYIWQEDNNATATLTSENWTTHDGLNAWTESFGQLSHTQTVRDVANAKVTTTRTAPDGSYTVSVTEDGLAKSTTRYDVNHVQLSQMTYGYDAWNRQNSLTDAGTGTTTTTFHEDGSVETVTTPDPDGAGPQAAQVTTTRSSGLDGLGYTVLGGRIETVTLPDAAVVTREYFPTGELEKQEGSRQYPVEYTYDYAGRMKTLKTWQDYVLDTGAATTTWSYNDAGVMTQKRYEDNKGPDYEYDIRGNLIKRTWARGKVTDYGYDSRGRLETIDYPASTTASVTNRYDRIGRIVEVEDASGTRTYEHGSSFLLEKEEYTANLFNGWKIERSYDSLRRPEQVELLHSTTPHHKVEYGYTDASRLESVRGHAITNNYSYATNRGVLDEIEQVGVQTVEIERDAIGRLKEINTYNQTATLSSHTYTYNMANQRIQATLADGSYWEYSYDDLGQVTAGVKKNSSGTALNGYSFGYTYDDIGNRKTSVENGRTTSYAPNLLNQYLGITRPAFAHLRGDRANTNTTIEVDLLNDSIPAASADYSNLLWYKEMAVTDLVSQFTITATENGNQNSATGSLYTPNGNEVPQYDDDGNLTRDHLWTYTWDSENRLVVQEHRSDVTLSPLSRTKIHYLYDSQNRRVQKRVFVKDVNNIYVVESSVKYLYDGWNLLSEIDVVVNNTVLKTYTWGLDLSGSMQGAGGVGGLLSVDNGSIVGLAVYDGNGNVMGYTDSSTGDLVAEYEYDPFGSRIRSKGDQEQTFAHRFSTKYEEAESGLLYYGFRYYDSEMGRWLNRDPIEERGGINLYSFVLNASTYKFDYLGKRPLKCCGPDVTFLLLNTLRIIRNQFDAFEDREQLQLCRALLLLPDTEATGGIAFNLVPFDIKELYAIGKGAGKASDLFEGENLMDGYGSGTCENTVSFRGGCYNAGHLNYAMWGAINYKCRKKFRNLAPRWPTYLVGPGSGEIARQFTPWTLEYATNSATLFKLGVGNLSLDTHRSVRSIVESAYRESGCLKPWQTAERKKCKIISSNKARGTEFRYRWDPLVDYRF